VTKTFGELVSFVHLYEQERNLSRPSLEKDETKTFSTCLLINLNKDSTVQYFQNFKSLGLASSHSHLGLISVLSRSRLILFLVLSRSRLSLVSVSSQSCLGLVSFSSQFCLKFVSVSSQSCLSLVSVLSRSCLGLVSVLSRSRLGLVSFSSRSRVPVSKPPSLIFTNSFFSLSLRFARALLLLEFR
jgi:hypothetical protein